MFFNPTQGLFRRPSQEDERMGTKSSEVFVWFIGL